MSSKKRKAFLLVLGLFVALVGGWLYCHMETYCFFYPSIDTTFADTFSEIAFCEIHPGMTKDDVQKLLGKPLSIVGNPDGTETWWYSRDGRCWFGDFAWLGRSVLFTNSDVVRIDAKVYED
jgi:outer membrane protein assembly factor BamE (lipoprotein component of BamABCDE complex)